jgi:hypothetical protein
MYRKTTYPNGCYMLFPVAYFPVGGWHENQGVNQLPLSSLAFCRVALHKNMPPSDRPAGRNYGRGNTPLLYPTVGE